MQQKSFYLEHLQQIEGPVNCSRLFDHYYNGEIHDCTLIWDSCRRCWYRFVELKLFYITTRQASMAFRPAPGGKYPATDRQKWLQRAAGHRRRGL